MSRHSPVLERHQIPWLIGVALCTTLPHAGFLPIWMTGLSALLLMTVAWQWHRGLAPLHKALKVLLVVVCTAGILFEYKTLLGRDAGIAMLVLFMALKQLELRTHRDATVVISLGYFLLLTHYFHAQDIPTGLWLILSTLLVTAALLKLQAAPTASPMSLLKTAGGLLLQALPLMLVLYLFFPRIPGPLWGLPQDAYTGRTGLSETMAPGNISELVNSPEIAFRAQFTGPPPTPQTRYWRGPVLDHYDGRAWQAGPTGREAAPVEHLGQALSYSLTMEAHKQHWLLALDMPARLPDNPELGARLDKNGTALSNRPLLNRQRYELQSFPSYRLDPEGKTVSLPRHLQLPQGYNPRTLELGRQWKSQGLTPEGTIQQALRMFREENFHYTLRPPLLGRNAMDDFLFSTRRGFCEHYASAFVVLMRAAGVPARVVTGYLGGEVNPVDGFMIIRQSDAHAWAEVWIKQKGWVRVDPTGAISPARIESSLASALPDEATLPYMELRWARQLQQRWEALNNQWNQWVLGYDQSRQQELLARLGFTDGNWRTLILLLGISTLVLLVGLSLWLFLPRTSKDPAWALWNKARKRLQTQGISAPDWESPMALVQRLETAAPHLVPAYRELARLVMTARYEANGPKMEALRHAYQQLPR